MATMNFPDTPAVDEIYTAPNGVEYQWDGSAWNVVSAAAGVPGPQGEAGPIGPTGPTGPIGPGFKYDGRIPTEADLAGVFAVTAIGEFWITDDKGEGWQMVANSNAAGGKAWSELGRLVGQDGVAGPQGIQGETGAQGVAGATGPQGPAGVEGPAGPTGPKGDQGEQGIPGLGITFKGRVATVGDLPSTAAQGDMYIVDATGDSWVWSASAAAFENAGPIVGPKGEQGVAGPTGSQGPAGADGATGPAGPKGDTGAQGPQGIQGPPGADGTGGGGAYLPLAGGTMTGGITLPTTVQSLTFGTSTYNVFGASGGIAMRYGTANIANFTATGTTFFQKITTPATGQGVEFGSGGAYLSKVGTGIGVYSGGGLRLTLDATKHTSTVPLVLPADPTAALEAATKQYVDSKAGATIVSVATGATEPAASGYPEGALLVRYTP
jgi:hypothetical protein